MGRDCCGFEFAVGQYSLCSFSRWLDEQGYLPSTYTRLKYITGCEGSSYPFFEVVTDRFALGNGSSPSCDTSQKTYCGGNWQGIINNLDYIQGMGFDAIWISPVVENVQGTTTEGEAYHGWVTCCFFLCLKAWWLRMLSRYWPQNINSLNSNFGSADDLKSLSSALHGKGMYLMVDVVVNQ